MIVTMARRACLVSPRFLSTIWTCAADSTSFFAWASNLDSLTAGRGGGVGEQDLTELRCMGAQMYAKLRKKSRVFIMKDAGSKQRGMSFLAEVSSNSGEEASVLCQGQIGWSVLCLLLRCTGAVMHGEFR